MTVDRTKLLDLVVRAEHATAAAREVTPESVLFGGIARQVRAIRADVAPGTAFDGALQERITLGVLAVREFEDTDPEYAELLQQIDFLYRYEGVLR